MSKNTGGPAFPNPERSFEEFGTRGWYPGMTLRDYFAAKAMQAMLACPVQPQSGPEMYARDAYVIADAMIAEREK